MDKYEYRRQRLIILMDEFCGGKIKTLAERLGRSDSYVSRMLYEEGHPHKKRIGDDMLDVISESFGVTKAWIEGEDTDATIHQRIKQARTAKGMTLEQVGAAVGVSTQAAQQWEKEENATAPRAGRLREIAKALGVSPEWLQFGIGDNDEGQGGLIAHDDITSFDLYDIKASCGAGVINSEFPDFVRRIDIPNTHLYTLFGTDNMAGMQIIGIDTDSMEPTIPRRSLVFIDIRVNYFEGDGVYAFVLGDELYVKRLQRLPGIIRAHSDNKKYDSFDIPKEDMDKLHIIARFQSVLPLHFIDV
ncbi:MAG: helix-turn-helix domain-containing protein [Neisseria sp.]|nr:helix-turn-helix domain-containing protein [Neisseria sp.]